MNQSKSQLSNLQNGHRKLLAPIFDHLKTLERSDIMFPHQKSVKKAFFLYDLPQGVLFCQNKSQLSNLQNRHREKLFQPPIFDLTLDKDHDEVQLQDTTVLICSYVIALAYSTPGGDL